MAHLYFQITVYLINLFTTFCVPSTVTFGSLVQFGNQPYTGRVEGDLGDRLTSIIASLCTIDLLIALMPTLPHKTARFVENE
jgi:hypothetical protein